MIAQPRLLCRYHYDPLDRIAGLAPTRDVETRLFYQKSRLATQIQAGMQHSILQVDDHLLAQASHSGKAAEIALLAQASHSGKAAEIALLAADGLRSVVHVVGSGQHQAQAYTAYGYQRPTSGLHSLLGFAGERPDPVTGHYLLGNGYRAFNPVLMRFNSPDRLSPFGEGGVNAYVYCQGDPVNFNDSTGRMPLPFKALGKMSRSLGDARPMPAAAASSSASSSASPFFDLDDFMIDFDRFQQGTPALTPSNLLVSGGVTPPTAQTAVSSLPSTSATEMSGLQGLRGSNQSGVLQQVEVRSYMLDIAKLKKRGALTGQLRKTKSASQKTYHSISIHEVKVERLVNHYAAKVALENKGAKELDKYSKMLRQAPGLVSRYRENFRHAYGHYPR